MPYYHIVSNGLPDRWPFGNAQRDGYLQVVVNTLRQKQNGRRFASHFLAWKWMYFNKYFPAICFQEYNQYQLQAGRLVAHYSDVIMSAMGSQIISFTIVYSTVYSGADQKKTSKFRVTGLCAWNSPVTGEFPAQMARNAANVSIWWRHAAEEVRLNSTENQNKTHHSTNHAYDSWHVLSPVLLLRHDAVARILANGSAAFFESCAAISWNDCDSVRSLW